MPESDLADLADTRQNENGCDQYPTEETEVGSNGIEDSIHGGSPTVPAGQSISIAALGVAEPQLSGEVIR